ncbi:solute carrier family 22 member 3-like [Amphibalanus amphitrite]|uniref:solute carrier family 22 member 3-like n=1 Tax=Amphibalanus amphitrite TaxID=1232801 RepID=UPI001C90B015|nr:solute carrier family 22 member 3-like [Amphibalanus amphitrite]
MPHEEEGKNGSASPSATQGSRRGSQKSSVRRQSVKRQASREFLPRAVQSSSISEPTPNDVTNGAGGGAPGTGRRLEGDFDEILEEVGGYGRFQWRILVLMQPPFMFLGFTLLSQLWLLLEPDHWCKVPELEALGFSPLDARNISIPTEERAGRQQFSRCQRYDVNFSQIADVAGWRPDADTPLTACSSGWHYDFSELYPTIVSDLDWVCDDAWKSPLSTALFFVGSIFGTLLFGAVSDRFGRLPALVAANLTACVAGVVSAFARSLGVFAVTRFTFGMANNLQTTLAMVFLSEFVGVRWRGMVVNLPLATSFCLGMTILPWIAWGAGHWQYVALATSIPMAFPLIYLVTGVPESCRWLQQTGQLDRAIAEMRRIAKENGRIVSEETWQQFTEAATFKYKQEQERPAPGLRQLARHPRLRTRMAVLMFSTAILLLLFDLTSRNTDFDVDIFTAQTLLAVSEAPADLLTWLLVDTLGRRWTITVSTALTSGAGLALAILLHLGTAPAAASTAVAVFCRFCTTVSVNVLMTLSMELIPTDVRSRAFSLTQVAGHAGSVLSPLILFLERVWRGLPQLVLAALALLGAVSVSLLPETRGLPLPDTLAEGEEFGKEQRWLQCYCGSEEDGEMHPGVSDERQGADNSALELEQDTVTQM